MEQCVQIVLRTLVTSQLKTLKSCSERIVYTLSSTGIGAAAVRTTAIAIKPSLEKCILVVRSCKLRCQTGGFLWSSWKRIFMVRYIAVAKLALRSGDLMLYLQILISRKREICMLVSSRGVKLIRGIINSSPQSSEFTPLRYHTSCNCILN